MTERFCKDLYCVLFSPNPKTLSPTNLKSTHICSCSGVPCDSSQKFVEQLVLSNENQIATVFTDIALLRNLQTLNLNTHALNGTIDTEIYTALVSLRNLILQNEFGGNIPSEFIENSLMVEVN